MHKNASPRYYSLLTGSPTDVARPADTHTAPAAMSQDQVMTILERYSPSVNADIARLLRSTYEAKDSMEADLHSARIYVLPATQPRGPELIETIEYCFSNPSRYAYDSFQMTVTTVADVDFLIRVIRAKLPCLRTCRVDSRYYDVESASYLNPPKFDFSALFAVAVASPYLDRLVFDLPGTTQLLYQLIPQCFRDDDPHPPMDVEFKDGSLALRRRLPLVSLKAVIGRPRVENSPIVALKFFSTVFNVRRRNAMAYSSFLSDLIATLPVADHVEVPIPEAYINAAGESESENRYSTVDVRLAVLWMNDYADDEVHAVLTKSPTPRHHVSLVGRHFYNEHIKGPNGDDVLGMKRCVSLLALSHFLHIGTLECLAASLLVSCASP